MEQVQRRAEGVSVDQQLGRGIVDPLLHLAGMGLGTMVRERGTARLGLGAAFAVAGVLLLG